MKSLRRSINRHYTERAIAHAMRIGKNCLLFGLVVEQPHRLHKNQPGYTYGSSLKKDKQLAHRADRRRAKMALSKEEYPPTVRRHSVLHNYW